MIDEQWQWMCKNEISENNHSVMMWYLMWMSRLEMILVCISTKIKDWMLFSWWWEVHQLSSWIFNSNQCELKREMEWTQWPLNAWRMIHTVTLNPIINLVLSQPCLLVSCNMVSCQTNIYDWVRKWSISLLDYREYQRYLGWPDCLKDRFLHSFCVS